MLTYFLLYLFVSALLFLFYYIKDEKILRDFEYLRQELFDAFMATFIVVVLTFGALPWIRLISDMVNLWKR